MISSLAALVVGPAQKTSGFYLRKLHWVCLALDIIAGLTFISISCFPSACTISPIAPASFFTVGIAYTCFNLITVLRFLKFDHAPHRFVCFHPIFPSSMDNPRNYAPGKET